MNYFLILAFLFGILPNFPVKVKASELSFVQSLPIKPTIREIQTVQNPTQKPIFATNRNSELTQKLILLESVNSQTLEQKIINSCAEFGCDSNQLIRVMRCESGGRNITGTWGHIGIFQFSSRTFYSFAQKYQVQNANIWNTDDQIEVTSQMFADGLGKQHWSCFNK